MSVADVVARMRAVEASLPGSDGVACFVKLYREPKFTDYLEKQAVLPAPGTPAEFAAFLKKDRLAAELLINIANQPREDYKAEQ